MFQRLRGFKVKGQVGVEFILLVSMLLSLSVIILANSFHEMELDFAVATARGASERLALQEGAVFYNISYSQTREAVVLEPLFSSQQFKDSKIMQIAGEVKGVISPNSEFESCTGAGGEGCCFKAGLSQGACFSTTRCFCLK